LIYIQSAAPIRYGAHVENGKFDRMDERPITPQLADIIKATGLTTEPSLVDHGVAFGTALRRRADHVVATPADKAFIDSLYGAT
jgi:dihydroorotase-like cyclic amidohydrolase